MKTGIKGRILAWILTIMMVVTYTPQIAFATDAVTPTTETTVSEETSDTHDKAHEVIHKMEQVVTDYELEASMSKDDMLSIIEKIDSEADQNLQDLVKINEDEDYFTKEEYEHMIEEYADFELFSEFFSLYLQENPSDAIEAKTVATSDGYLEFTDSYGTGVLAEDKYSATAPEGNLATNTNTLTIKNISSKTLTINYDLKIVSKDGTELKTVADKAETIKLNAGETTTYSCESMTRNDDEDYDGSITLSNLSYASEEEAVDAVVAKVSSDENTSETSAEKEPTRVERILELIEIVLNDFDITVGMSDDEIAKAIQYADVDNDTWDAYDEIESYVDQVTDSEIEEVMSHEIAETYTAFYNVMQKMNSPMLLTALSDTYTLDNGITVSVSSTNDSSGSISSLDKGTVIVETAASSSTSCGVTSYTPDKVTVTITNSTSNYGNISFDWEGKDIHSLNVCGNSPSDKTKGTCSKVLVAPGKSTEIIMETDKNSTNNKLTLKNIEIEEIPTHSDVTFEYDITLGSITAGGEAVTSGTIKSVSFSEGVVLEAIPNDGCEFKGWMDGNSKVLSTNTSYTCNPTEDIIVEAVFLNTASTSDGPFGVGTNKFTDLNYAGKDAALGSDNTVVLLENYTLPVGDYTIPSGVTLLIPFDEGNTLYTTAPSFEDSYTAPTIYRKLQMASGSSIEVDGSVSVSSKLSAKTGTNGSPTGACGVIDMADDSRIIVNSDGKLYVWGYIGGKGSILAKQNAMVYEGFQATDWRGGRATTNMLGDDTGVFPMSQYYVQNVQVPMTLQAGAIENGLTAVTVTYLGIQQSIIPFIGGDGLFSIRVGFYYKRL